MLVACVSQGCERSWDPAKHRASKRYCTKYCGNRDYHRRPPASRTCAYQPCSGSWVIASRHATARHCSRECAGRAYRQRPGARARHAAGIKRRRRAAIGRVCRWCQVQDGDRQFATRTVCTRCDRALRRQACERCGGPSYQREPACLVRWRAPYGTDCRLESLE